MSRAGGGGGAGDGKVAGRAGDGEGYLGEAERKEGGRLMARSVVRVALHAAPCALLCVLLWGPCRRDGFGVVRGHIWVPLREDDSKRCQDGLNTVKMV